MAVERIALCGVLGEGLGLLLQHAHVPWWGVLLSCAVLGFTIGTVHRRLRNPPQRCRICHTIGTIVPRAMGDNFDLLCFRCGTRYHTQDLPGNPSYCTLEITHRGPRLIKPYERELFLKAYLKSADGSV